MTVCVGHCLHHRWDISSQENKKKTVVRRYLLFLTRLLQGQRSAFTLPLHSCSAQCAVAARLPQGSTAQRVLGADNKKSHTIWGTIAVKMLVCVVLFALALLVGLDFAASGRRQLLDASLALYGRVHCRIPHELFWFCLIYFLI